MRLLLDTHVLLWAAADSDRLPSDVRAWLEDGANHVYFSAASLWEIGIKSALGRKDLRIDLPMLQTAVESIGFLELPVTGAHAIGVTRLPRVNRDPFDRLLVAQSIVEQLILVTHDGVLRPYGSTVRVV